MHLDLSLMFWRRGYDALPRLWRSAEHEAPDSCPVTFVDARVAGRRAAVVRGRPNAERFYDERRVHRASAVPLPLAALLFGRGAVHGTDGDQHRHRKAMFLDLLDDTAVTDVVGEARLRLDRALDDATAPALHVHELLQEVYGGAVMAWAGIDLDEDGLRLRSRQLGAVVDGFGFQRGSVLRAVRARRELDRWATTLVRRARSTGAASSLVERVARHRDEDGALLPAKVAGIELLNVLRPTVAVAFLGSFGIDALADQRVWRHRVATHAEDAHAFAQEVRRLAPFVPALAAKASMDQSWGGHHVARGTRVVLDVPAVNRDPHTWREPELFDPSRFLAAPAVGPFDMVPQGGGEPTGHRCPGEPLTIALLSMTLQVLAAREEWTATAGPHDRTRIPARPDAWLRR